MRRWALLWALPLVSACVSGGFLSPPASRPGTAPEAWQVPAGAYPSQRLYRVKYAGPEGRAGFKLTLYLNAAADYRMAAADSLGRKLWSLEVAASGGALWLDHRQQEYCQARGADQLLLVPLAHLPLVALPRLLLGRMPAEPVANLVRGVEHVAYLDARGQAWSGVFRGGELAWWSLEEGGEPVAWWRRNGDRGGRFTDPRGGLELSWEEVVAEALKQPPAELEIPARFREGACGQTVG